MAKKNKKSMELSIEMPKLEVQSEQVIETNSLPLEAKQESIDVSDQMIKAFGLKFYNAYKLAKEKVKNDK